MKNYRRHLGLVLITGLLGLNRPCNAQSEQPVNASYEEGKEAGVRAANESAQTKWFLGSLYITGASAGVSVPLAARVFNSCTVPLVAPCIVGPAVGGYITFRGYSSRDSVGQVPPGTAEFQRGYVDGYSAGLRGKKGEFALGGAVLGTAAVVVATWGFVLIGLSGLGDM